MIIQAIDRSRPTQGSMAVSFVLHSSLLLLLFFMLGQQVAELDLGDELTEIAYIEARYGEDVAAQVKMKTPPRRPGMGVSTDSAQKPKPAEPELPKDETPRPEPRPALTKMPELPQQTLPQTRVEVTEVNAPQIAPTNTQPRMLSEAAQLQAQAMPAPNRKIIDAEKLAGAMQGKMIEARAPRTARPTEAGAFKPKAGGALESRQGLLATGDAALPTNPGGRSSAGVSEAPAAAAAGGALKGSARAQTYQSPVAGLQSADKNRSGTTDGKGVVDVDGPRGGGSERGRKTILDYGSGSGGRGGGLAGKRTRLVEPPTTETIVADDAADDAAPQAVAEVPVADKGVGMTISGQIKGRKILRRVAPEYSRKARTKGWEGVVAVHFTVLADGRVKDNVYFEQTSVHRDLNQAALEAIKQFRFAPLPAEQAAIEQWGVITIVFRLN